jgi:hypothetical protein
MTLGPVLVTVDPARTAKLVAVPSCTGPAAATADWLNTNVAMAMTPTTTGEAATQK